MKKVLVALLVNVSVFISSVFAADDSASAIAMVERGVAYHQKNGKDALIREVNNKNPEFNQGPTYMVVRDLEGTVLAHPVNPRLIGKNLNVLPDVDGKYFRKEIVDTALTKGKGWVDYRYNNPVTKEIEKKSVYLVKSGDLIIEAGIYKGK